MYFNNLTNICKCYISLKNIVSKYNKDNDN